MHWNSSLRLVMESSSLESIMERLDKSLSEIVLG